MNIYRIFFFSKRCFQLYYICQLHVCISPTTWPFGRWLSWLWIPESARWMFPGRLVKVQLHWLSKWVLKSVGSPRPFQGTCKVRTMFIIVRLWLFHSDSFVNVLQSLQHVRQNSERESRQENAVAWDLAIKETWKNVKWIPLLTFPFGKQLLLQKNYHFSNL